LYYLLSVASAKAQGTAVRLAKKIKEIEGMIEK
jgi:hypothetical protein